MISRVRATDLMPGDVVVGMRCFHTNEPIQESCLLVSHTNVQGDRYIYAQVITKSGFHRFVICDKRKFFLLDQEGAVPL